MERVSRRSNMSSCPRSPITTADLVWSKKETFQHLCHVLPRFVYLQRTALICSYLAWMTYAPDPQKIFFVVETCQNSYHVLRPLPGHTRSNSREMVSFPRMDEVCRRSFAIPDSSQVVGAYSRGDGSFTSSLFAVVLLAT
jgi:hypothetical protein